MDSTLKPQGVFFLFSFFSFVAVFYVYYYMAETMGLSEKQKKALYVPGAKFGRKLKAQEQAIELADSPAIHHKQIMSNKTNYEN